jgi:transposase-like protein
MHCPDCSTSAIVKRGLRKTKTGPLQLFFCKKCRKRFSLSPLPWHTYRAEVVLSAPVYYFLGHTLREIQGRIRARFKQKPSLAMISLWIKKFGRYSPLKSQRDKIRAFAPPHRIIRKKLIKHRHNHLLQVHLYKLSLLRGHNGTLVGKYLHDLLTGNVGTKPERSGLRASGLPLELGDVHVRSKSSYASAIAGIALKAARANCRRHAMVQKFLLATDSATIAVEVPVFLTGNETQRILGKGEGLVGHIDILQIFDETVQVLDYKPEAEKEKNVTSQLFLYALALSRRTGIHLKHVRCAWFDERGFFSFPAINAYAAFKMHSGS